VPLNELLAAAGYLEEQKGISRREIEQAYQHVISDPKHKHGTRLKGSLLSLEAKRFIVEMHERMTKRKLLRE
jgi:HTH-type transcriptional regulator, competence development regulator